MTLCGRCQLQKLKKAQPHDRPLNWEENPEGGWDVLDGHERTVILHLDELTIDCTCGARE